MAFVTKIKWVVLSVVTLSVASIIIHLSFAKLWSVNLVQYKALPILPDDFGFVLGRQVIKNKKLWGSIESLETLQPNANARSNYSVPKEHSNGFIYAKVFGGFAKIRSSISDLVAISRLLNATLVIPEIQESTHSKGISLKFKSFSYLYNEEQFIAYLKNDVVIAKSLPESLMERRKGNEIPTFKATSSSSPNFYLKEILPKLKKSKVIGLVIANGGALQSTLPTGMAEIQRLRCRVAFHALQFRPEIQALGRRMHLACRKSFYMVFLHGGHALLISHCSLTFPGVNVLRALGQPFLAFHPGLLRETLAYNGCAELFQDVHTELIQHQRSRMIKQGILKDELNVDSHLRREKGLCPLMPEEKMLGYKVGGDHKGWKAYEKEKKGRREVRLNVEGGEKLEAKWKEAERQRYTSRMVGGRGTQAECRTVGRQGLEREEGIGEKEKETERWKPGEQADRMVDKGERVDRTAERLKVARKHPNCHNRMGGKINRVIREIFSQVTKAIS
ncbi:hypothetical protein V8G54_005857 [Vigna mungo]|uniref:O-fucosyltransferase family protein n=1 Tax=Vigna mungo TaxID=3915 RepID=A0AAQ3P010_VIGMU